ncbi:hypothetical protein [Streptomyces albireticuli]|uniref:hypothetical protein n=1 Tax=Streptomyces albireticuli TaxID=1940 RepID=UPI00369C3AD2
MTVTADQPFYGTSTMIYFALIAFFLLGAASLSAAVTGYRGQVCDPHDGYDLPSAVAEDSALEQTANELIAFWCTGAAILSAAPLIALFGILLRDGDAPLTGGALTALTGYGILVVAICRYPFKKIKRLTADG